MSKRYTQNQVQPSNMPNLTPLQSINLNQPVPHRANQHARAHADDAMFLRFQHALANPHTADAAAEWQELCRLYHARAIGWANRHPLIGVVVVEPAAIAQDACSECGAILPKAAAIFGTSRTCVVSLNF